jgi:hypothetical protein
VDLLKRSCGELYLIVKRFVYDRIDHLDIKVMEFARLLLQF